jgi:selenide,water dikinase
MGRTSDNIRNVVLAGGGDVLAAVLKRFGKRPDPHIRLIVIAGETDTPYSGMLPGLIAGHYAHRDGHIDLGRLARGAGADLFHGDAVGLDLARRQVICAGRTVPYDILSLDLGASLALDMPGAAEHAIPVMPTGQFLRQWQDLQARIAAFSGRPFLVAVVGGGAGAVELALAMRHRLGAAPPGGVGAPRAYILLVTGTPDILPGYPPKARRIFRRVLAARGIAVHVGRRVAKVEAARLILDNGQTVPTDAVLWAAGAAPGWLGETGLALDEDGVVRVDAALRSVSHPAVFAAGGFAARAGDVLADNLRRAAHGRSLRHWRPSRRPLRLIGTGDRYAVLARGSIVAEGAWVWRLKDRIDRRWMRQFGDLPAPRED